jgi:hypothetical protein
MRFTELNPEGDYTHWETEKLEELKQGHFKESPGNKLIFQNETVRLWALNLAPFERLPFRIYAHNYSWSCEDEGLIITRNSNGQIILYAFEAEDTGYVDLKGKPRITDIENIGPSKVCLHILEYWA